MTRTSRWSLILTTGLGLTVVAAGVAASTRASDRLLTFLVFAVAVGPVLLGGAWVLVPDPSRPAAPEHDADTVERAWVQRAAGGAFPDLLTAMGLSLAVTTVLSAPQPPLVIFVALGLVDFLTRYAVVARREG